MAWSISSYKSEENHSCVFMHTHVQECAQMCCHLVSSALNCFLNLTLIYEHFSLENLISIHFPICFPFNYNPLHAFWLFCEVVFLFLFSSFIPLSSKAWLSVLWKDFFLSLAFVPFFRKCGWWMGCSSLNRGLTSLTASVGRQSTAKSLLVPSLFICQLLLLYDASGWLACFSLSCSIIVLRQWW